MIDLDPGERREILPPVHRHFEIGRDQRNGLQAEQIIAIGPVLVGAGLDGMDQILARGGTVLGYTAVAQTDPTEAMRTIRRVAADAWDRALAKRNEGRER